VAASANRPGDGAAGDGNGLMSHMEFVAADVGSIYTGKSQGDRMHLSRRVVGSLLLGAGLLIGGCQHAAAPLVLPEENVGPTAEERSIADHVGQMKMVAQGVNKQLAFKATAFGQILLYDQETGDFIYRGSIAAGERFVFEPASSRAEINKETVDLAKITNQRDEYRLYYVPQ
jgi:hypothetical protein